MSHHCHALGCKTPTSPEMLMCLRHWRMVSGATKAAVLRAYRRGQCDDKQPSREWLDAATRARGEVAEMTGQGEAFRRERESFAKLQAGMKAALSSNTHSPTASSD